jgi:hypothetical protein
MVDINFNLTEREKGWLEGIIDGEGYLAILKNKNKNSKNGYVWSMYLSVTSTRREICEKLLKLFSNEKYVGGNIIKKPAKNKNCKDAYYFMAKRYSAKRILPQLNFVIKERHRELLIKALDLVEKYRIGEYFMGGNGRPPEVENEIIKLYEEMKILNKRGN